MKLQLAKEYLIQNSCTCVAFDGSSYLSSAQRGVAPLLAWLDAGISLKNCAVADKVIGKGAAFLYVKLQPEQIHAQVISRPALLLLQRENVCVTYDTLVDGIRNRDNSGPCPIESAVIAAESADNALEKIRETLRELRSNTPY